MSEPKLLFISYSHDDQEWLDKLKIYLKALERQGILKTWDDSQIQAGDIWRDKIEEALAAAGAALLLVSQNFLASDFIRDHELYQLLENVDHVFWVAVSASTVEFEDQITQYQAAHHDPPLDQLDDGEQNQAFLAIVRQIKAAMAPPGP